MATDMADMLLEYRDRVGPEEAYALSAEILTLSDQILKARMSVTTDKAREHFAQGRTLCLRAMVALERLAARSRIPLVASASIHERLSSLAGALGALAERPPWE
jgi:hypothetical protein